MHAYIVCASLQLQNTASPDEFVALLSSDEFEFRYHCGLPQPACCIDFADKEKVVADLSLHYSVLVSLAELEQLRRGLALQKFSSLMQSHPRVMRKAFQTSDHKISSEYIQDLFVPRLSLRGSNQREVEEAIVMTWIRYLQNIEGTYTCSL